MTITNRAERSRTRAVALTTTAALTLGTLGVFGAPTMAQAASLSIPVPTVTLDTPTVVKTTLRDPANQAVSTTVNVPWTATSESSVSGSCTAVKAQGKTTGYTKTVTTTAVTSKKTLTAAVKDDRGNTAVNAQANVETGSITATLPIAQTPDGKVTVTVDANASETVTTTTTPVTDSYAATDSSCSVSNSSVPGTVTTKTATNSGKVSGTAAYVVDLAGPTLQANLSSASSQVATNGTIAYHVAIKDGSGSAPFTLTLTATGIDGATEGASWSADQPGNFEKSTKGDGISATKNLTIGFLVPCLIDGATSSDPKRPAPLGAYQLTARLQSKDVLQNAAFDETFTVGTFTVFNDSQLQTDTVVTGIDPTSGELTPLHSFTAVGVASAKKFNTTPGAFNLTEAISVAGGCSASDKMVGLTGTVALPAESLGSPVFSWATNGKSPELRVYAGLLQGNLIDYANPTASGLTEITFDGKSASATRTPTGMTFTIGTEKYPAAANWTYFVKGKFTNYSPYGITSTNWVAPINVTYSANTTANLAMINGQIVDKADSSAWTMTVNPIVP